jgi:hypothetical protein
VTPPSPPRSWPRSLARAVLRVLGSRSALRERAVAQRLSQEPARTRTVQADVFRQRRPSEATPPRPAPGLPIVVKAGGDATTGSGAAVATGEADDGVTICLRGAGGACVSVPVTGDEAAAALAGRRERRHRQHTERRAVCAAKTPHVWRPSAPPSEATTPVMATEATDATPLLLQSARAPQAAVAAGGEDAGEKVGVLTVQQWRRRRPGWTWASGRTKHSPWAPGDQ